MAASPDLYEVAKLVVKWGDNPMQAPSLSRRQFYEAAKKAIAKAEGINNE